MVRQLLIILNTLILLGSLIIPAAAATLWYNGDYNGYTTMLNGQNFEFSAAVYDDFIVPAGGLIIDTVWSNNQIDPTSTISQAYWEIRSGVSAGSGGTLEASGTAPATLTPTGRSGVYYLEYTVQVSGLDVHLDPGTYWLSVAPISTHLGYGTSGISTTNGANAVGNPPGNDQNSFWNSADFAFNFGATPYDFSMGVGGAAAVPLPGAAWLLGSGLVGLWGLRRKFLN